MKEQTKIIAVAGKGGVGKTSIAAVIVKLLVNKYPNKRILAIDADPAVGLATALNIQEGKTIDDIRKEVIETVEEGNTKAAIELLSEAKYRIFDALIEKDGFSFIPVGRPESAGCYCKINGYLKDVIKILADNFDYVVIDGEAGIEQINRRVMEKVTHLLLVTDSSKKGISVVNTIKKVADELVMYDKIGVIANRLFDTSMEKLIDTKEVQVLSYIYNDSNLAEFDLLGKNVFMLPMDCPIVAGVEEALEKIHI